MNRRGFVSAAAVGVGAAWVAPAVISLPANGTRALVNSPPPTSSTTTTTTEPDDGNLNNNEDQAFEDPETAAVASSNLPRTGMDLQQPLTAAFGLIAAGGALQVWSAQRERLVAATIPPEDHEPTV